MDAGDQPSLNSRGLPRTNPLADLIRDRLEGLTPTIQPLPADYWKDSSYQWGAAGPGPEAVTKVGHIVQVSAEQWADLLGFEEAIRRAAEIRKYLRGRWLADPISAFPIIRAYCMRVATITLADQRAYEAQRCLHCGCHPDEHGRDW